MVMVTEEEAFEITGGGTGWLRRIYEIQDGVFRPMLPELWDASGTKAILLAGLTM